MSKVGPRLLLVLVLALTLAGPVPAQALTARQIMDKVDARDDGDNMITTQEMILIDKRGHQRVRQIKSFSKDKGRDTL
ncbi:MAG: outer membrane lipoprotein-sorting protein, partial [Deltaproteobacteria bacterium]|nr:outer membrane lipoprotein-sorting protein [Deltaproteobacteria bacterium]